MNLSRKSRGLVSAVGLVPVSFAAVTFVHFGHSLYGFGLELVAIIVYSVWTSLGEPDETEEYEETEE